MTARHRVVIVGGGFGGLAAAKALRRAPVDVTVVDRQAYHLFQPLLYQVATGVLSQGNIAPPLRDVLRHQRNAEVVLAEVGGVDLERRVVECSLLDRTWELSYDSLIVAAGSAQSYFGHDEFGLHAPGMKTIDDALEVRGRIFGAFELAELEDDPARRAAWMTFVVVGAGPTGVEMAGQIAELSRYSLPSNFRRIDTAAARIVLVDGGPRILSSFDERLARRAAAKLERMGVEIRTETLVTDMDAGGVQLLTPDGGERLDAMTKIWSAGVQASPLGSMLAAQAGVEPTRTGQVPVERDCTLPGHPEVFVVGDLMALDGLPGLAEVAIQSGRHAAAEIQRRLDGDAQPQAFSVPRPRKPRRRVALLRDRRARGHPRVGIRRLADLARRPPHLPDRLQEPRWRALPLDDQLLRALAPRADDHRPAGIRPPGACRVRPAR